MAIDFPTDLRRRALAESAEDEERWEWWFLVGLVEALIGYGVTGRITTGDETFDHDELKVRSPTDKLGADAFRRVSVASSFQEVFDEVLSGASRENEQAWKSWGTTIAAKIRPWINEHHQSELDLVIVPPEVVPVPAGLRASGGERDRHNQEFVDSGARELKIRVAMAFIPRS